LKKSKQIYISIIDNKNLDILQNILTNNLKNRILSTRNLLKQKFLLKKIKNILKRYLIKYIAKVSKLRYYFKKLLHKYYRKYIYF
jgi:hypothetical protein